MKTWGTDMNCLNDIIKNFAGKNVLIHSSLRSFDTKSKELPKFLVDTFLENDCTILVPTFSYEYEVHPTKELMPKQNGAGDYSYFLGQKESDFAPFTTDSTYISDDMGNFPKYILNHKDSVRGNNPLNSFTAIGKNADKMVNSQSASNVYAPLKYLYKTDGLVILMGVDLHSATIIHYAEELSGRNLFVRWAKNLDGKTIGVHTGSCSNGFNKFNKALENAVKTVTVDGSTWSIFTAKDIVDICTKEIKNSQNITHCGDKTCDRCNDAVLGGPIYS